MAEKEMTLEQQNQVLAQEIQSLRMQLFKTQTSQDEMKWRAEMLELMIAQNTQSILMNRNLEELKKLFEESLESVEEVIEEEEPVPQPTPVKAAPVKKKVVVAEED